MAGPGIHPYHHQHWAPPPAMPPPIPVENPSRPPTDEVRTIFISGLPEDVKERELQNLLRWLPGYEASQVNFKGEQPMGFALFSTAQQAMHAKTTLQDLVFDAEKKSVLHTEMAKKNLFVKRGTMDPRNPQSSSNSLEEGKPYPSPWSSIQHGKGGYNGYVLLPIIPPDGVYTAPPPGFRPRALDAQGAIRLYGAYNQGKTIDGNGMQWFSPEQVQAMNPYFTQLMARGGVQHSQPAGLASPPVTSQPSGNIPSPQSVSSELEGSGRKRSRGNEIDPTLASKKPKGKEKANDAERSIAKWEDKHDDVLVPFLAEQARAGLKASKSFKRVAFSNVAAELNRVFGESFTTDNVMNHLRVIKHRFSEMVVCKGLSGAHWDDIGKQITMGVDSLEYHQSKNTSSKILRWINKPLKHFDDLITIIGDDTTTWTFEKNSRQQFRRPPEPSGDAELSEELESLSDSNR